MTEPTFDTIKADDTGHRARGRAPPAIVAATALFGGLAVVAMLCLGLALLLVDALPNAASLRYSSVSSNDAPSPDGIAALGLIAHADDDPLIVGTERLRAFRRYLADHEGREEPPEVSDYPADRRLARPGARCWTLDRTCLRAVVPPETTLGETLAEHAVLLARLDRWLEADDVRLPVDPSRIGWAGPGTHLVGALRLRLAHLVDEVGRSDAAMATHRLEQLLTRLRIRLAQADTLLEKMLVARMVSLTLDGLVLVPAEEAEHAVIAPLTVGERHMTRPFAAEFRIAHDSFRNVLAHQDHDSPIKAVIFHAARAVLDVGASTNVVADRLAVQEAMAVLPRATFDAARARHAAIRVRPPLDPANLVGSWIIASDDEPDYTPYVAYLHGLDQKIRLLGRFRTYRGPIAEACGGLDDCAVTAIDDTGRMRVCPGELAAPSRPSFSCLPLESLPASRIELSDADVPGDDR